MIIIEFNDRYVNHCGGDGDVDANSHFMEMSLDQAGMEYGTIMIS